VVSVGQHPFFLDDLLGAGEPFAPLILPDWEVACLRQSLIVAHQFEDSVEFGPFGEPFRIELRHHGEGPIEKAERSIRIELGRPCSHSVGQLALGFDVPRQLGARVLELLDVSGKSGDGSRGKRHVDNPKHPSLAVNDRRLHARDDPLRLLRLPRARDCAVLAFRVDQLGGSLNHVGGVLSFHSMDECTVDEAELEIGPAVPHRERRSLDEMGQGSESAFRLPQAQRELRPFLLAHAGIEKPQE
jgi:hypothetical protein